MAAYPRSELPKECSECKQTKPALDFTTCAGKLDGLYSHCKPCKYRRYPPRQRNPYPRSVVPKECTLCKQVKPALDFHIDKSTPSRLNGYCKPCTTRYQRLNKYQLQPADFEAMLEAQGNACAICSDQFTDKLVACVDHDHNCCPGQYSCGACVRGLLCGHCNRGIGCLRDDPQRLRQAVLYLEGTEVASV